MFYQLVHKVEDLVHFLQNKKTHIIVGVGVVVNFVNFLTASGQFNFSIPHLAQINVILGFLGLSAIHAKLSRIKQ